VIASLASACVFAFSSLLLTYECLAFPWWSPVYAVFPLAAAIVCGAAGAAAWLPALRRLRRSGAPHADLRSRLRSIAPVLFLIVLAIACAWVALRERQYMLREYEPMN
jgi:hypothetical protein